MNFICLAALQGSSFFKCKRVNIAGWGLLGGGAKDLVSRRSLAMRPVNRDGVGFVGHHRRELENEENHPHTLVDTKVSLYAFSNSSA